MRATEPRMISGSISWIPCASVYRHRARGKQPQVHSDAQVHSEQQCASDWRRGAVKFAMSSDTMTDVAGALVAEASIYGHEAVCLRLQRGRYKSFGGWDRLADCCENLTEPDVP